MASVAERDTNEHRRDYNEEQAGQKPRHSGMLATTAARGVRRDMQRNRRGCRSVH
jgi:hypothetical protein